MNYRYCLGQDGLALQRNVYTLLLAVKQAGFFVRAFLLGRLVLLSKQAGASQVTSDHASDMIGSGSAALVG